jgi:hypothetical protein
MGSRGPTRPLLPAVRKARPNSPGTPLPRPPLHAHSNPGCIYQPTGNATEQCDTVANATSTTLVPGTVGGASKWGTQCLANDPGTVGPFSSNKYNVTPADPSADATPGYPVYVSRSPRSRAPRTARMHAARVHACTPVIRVLACTRRARTARICFALCALACVCPPCSWPGHS